MVVNEQERVQAILDAAADLLCRLGYNKLTVGDVADAVALNRGLVYLRFKSKDELVEAVLLRELGRYADSWRDHLQADPQGGSVASVYRAMVHTMTKLPLAAAFVAKDEAIFGKYLRKRDNLVDRLSDTMGTRDFLEAMRAVGAVRADIDSGAVAFILDALTPAIRRTLPTASATDNADTPTPDELLAALADLLEHGLAPSGGADLAAGKAVLLSGLAQVRTQYR